MGTYPLARTDRAWGWVIGAARAGWLGFAVLALGIVLGGIVPYSRQLATVCEQVPCLAGQYRPAEFAVLGVPDGSLLPVAEVQQGVAAALFVAAVAFMVAGFGIWRRPHDPAVVLLAFVAVAFGAQEFLAAIVREVPRLDTGATVVRVVYLAGLGPCVWLLPDAERRVRWLAPVVLMSVLAGMLVVLRPESLAAGVSFVVILTILALASLVGRFRASPGARDRERLTWTAAGLAMLGGAQMSGRPIAPFPLPRPEFGWASPNVFALISLGGMALLIGAFACLAVATLRDEVLDAELVLNRTLAIRC